jgi:tRNA(Ile2) C34 agmatinyltransferase TiaS
MARARAYEEIRLCEECGQPIQSGRENQFLCRRCQDLVERRKRKGNRLRQDRRDSHWDQDSEDW